MSYRHLAPNQPLTNLTIFPSLPKSFLILFHSHSCSNVISYPVNPPKCALPPFLGHLRPSWHFLLPYRFLGSFPLGTPPTPIPRHLRKVVGYGHLASDHSLPHSPAGALRSPEVSLLPKALCAAWSGGASGLCPSPPSRPFAHVHVRMSVYVHAQGCLGLHCHFLLSQIARPWWMGT